MGVRAVWREGARGGEGALEAAGSQGAGRSRSRAAGGAGAGAGGGARARAGAPGEGRAGHRPRPLPGPAPRRSHRGRPGGRRAGCIPILGVARHGARASGAGGRSAAGGAPGRPWPPPAPRAPPCCSPSATPCSCPSTRYPRRPCWRRALAAPSPAVCHPRGSRDSGHRLRRGPPLEGSGRPACYCPRAISASRPSPACPPSPHPGRARATRGGSGHRRARVHAWPCCPPRQIPDPGRACAGHSAIRSPEATCSACGYGYRRCRKAVLWGSPVSVPCARGTECPTGKQDGCTSVESALDTRAWRGEASLGRYDLHCGTVCIEVWLFEQRGNSLRGRQRLGRKVKVR